MSASGLFDPDVGQELPGRMYLSPVLAVLIVAAVLFAGDRLMARHRPVAVTLIQATSFPTTRRSAAVGPIQTGTATTANATCAGYPLSPAWSCQNGSWVVGPASATNTGGGGASAGCTTSQPGPSMQCDNGVWVVANQTTNAAASSTASATRAASTTDASATAAPSQAAGSPSSIGCATSAPGPGWTCMSGSWMPPDPGRGNPAPPAPAVAPETVLPNSR